MDRFVLHIEAFDRGPILASNVGFKLTVPKGSNGTYKYVLVGEEYGKSSQ